MDFEWDERKNKSNLEKHGISFESAKDIFHYPILKKIDNRKDYGEERYIALGILKGICVVVVIFTEREKTRIISIRRANREETKIYKNGFQKT